MKSALPKLACVCCTYLRPRQLANLVDCFLRFDYPPSRRSLTILDDAGQYPDQPSGPGWRIVSVRERAPTLGQKRNRLAELVPHDTDALVVMDDDDAYLPWTLLAHAHALQRAATSRPAWVFNEASDGRLLMQPAAGYFHAAWAYTRELFERVNGYPAWNSGEDRILWSRMEAAGAKGFDATLSWPPYFVHRWETSGAAHLSGLPGDGYQRFGALAREVVPVIGFAPASLRDYQVSAARSLGTDADDVTAIRRRWQNIRPCLSA